jgi:hypothetical protein
MANSLREVGRTLNTDYFVAADDVLIVMPHPGSRDDGETARENVRFQLDYARKLGRRIGTVVYVANLLSQDAAARKVYSSEMDPECVYGAALIVSNQLSRAIGSFFLGLARPPFPTRMFDGVEAAIAWLETQRPEGP